MVKNMREELITFKKKQFKLFKIYTFIVVIVTLIGLLNTACDILSNSRTISEAASNLSFYDEIVANFTDTNIYNTTVAGINIISIIATILEFVISLIHNILTFVIVSISTIVQIGKESKVKNTISKVLNIIAIAEIITYFLFVLNFDFGSMKELVSISTVILIYKLVSKFAKLIILVIETIIISVFTFCKIKEEHVSWRH